MQLEMLPGSSMARKPPCAAMHKENGLKRSIQCNSEAFVVIPTKTGKSVGLCHFCFWLNSRGAEWNPEGTTHEVV